MSDKRKFDVRTFPAKQLIRMFDPETQMTVIADALNTKRSTVYKWYQNDVQITQWAADRYAVRLGLHPSAIWHDWFCLEAV